MLKLRRGHYRPCRVPDAQQLPRAAGKPGAVRRCGACWRPGPRPPGGLAAPAAAPRSRAPCSARSGSARGALAVCSRMSAPSARRGLPAPLCGAGPPVVLRGFGPRPRPWAGSAPLRRAGPRPGSVGLGLSARALARRSGPSFPPPPLRGRWPLAGAVRSPSARSGRPAGPALAPLRAPSWPFGGVPLGGSPLPGPAAARPASPSLLPPGGAVAPPGPLFAPLPPAFFLARVRARVNVGKQGFGISF